MPSVLESLNNALHLALKNDERVFIIGEDILDPYGGAFKVTRGLSSTYPERVLTSPVSEAGMVGLAAGMALRGMRPVVEIMFGDFIALAADQLINHAAKFRWMYNDQVRVPLVVRTPMGGGRGYGPTHSQSLEKLFLGVPGLRVIAPGTWNKPGDLLYQSILGQDDPVLFIEHKLLYPLPVVSAGDLPDFDLSLVQDDSEPGWMPPTGVFSIQGAPPAQLTLAAYGYMAETARQAVYRLAFEAEIFCELVVPTQLAPVKLDALIDSCRQTTRLLVIEEGTRSLGWGAEVLATCAEALGPHLQAGRRLASKDLPIPASSPMEQAHLPNVDAIIQFARKMV